VAQLAECLASKHEALSSKPIPQKKKKKKRKEKVIQRCPCWWDRSFECLPCSRGSFCILCCPGVIFSLAVAAVHTRHNLISAQTQGLLFCFPFSIYRQQDGAVSLFLVTLHLLCIQSGNSLGVSSIISKIHTNLCLQ
jgi:hypothetical protein